MLGACETQAVRACRHCLEGAQREADHDLADRLRSRSQDGRHLHAGTFHQRDATFVCLSVRMADGLRQILVSREI